MREFGVSHEEVDAYHNEHKDEFDHIETFLRSEKEEDVQKCLALLYILTHGRCKEKDVNMERQYYGKYPRAQKFQYNTPGEIINYAEIIACIEQYKVFLLTALANDDDFFKEVLKWYREIFEYVGEAENKHRNKRNSPSSRRHLKPHRGAFGEAAGIFPAQTHGHSASGTGIEFDRFDPPIAKYSRAGAGADTGFEEFEDFDSPIELEDGVLKILGDTKNNIYFKFTFKDYPFVDGETPAETAPYSIRFFFTTTKDSAEPERDALLEKDNIIANNPLEKALTIQSEPIENVAYTKGLFILGRKNE
jgi:hypothetical protein